MLQIRIVSPTNHKVNWPTKDPDILASVQQYLTYEISLPAQQQLAGLSATVLQAQLNLVLAADLAAKTAEETRAYQANLLANEIDAVKPKIAQATLTLKSQHFGTEAILEQWDYKTTIGQDGKINVRQPSTPKDILAFMPKYVAKETTLAVGEQISTPSLAEMTAHNTAIQAAVTARDAAQAQREAAIDTRGREARKLLYLYQLACGMRVMLTYNGLITNDLENWGFQVVAPTAPPPDGGLETGGA